ncbi:UDP-N-acetylmuramate--alanine ligase, partial [bacterium]|nr:UDP-N-acetylmuramate--alanine ligase [bacterium]
PAAEQIEKTGTGIKFSFHGNHYELPLFGRHNAENAVAALSLIDAAIPNAPYDVCYGALKLFPGIRRRMQRHGRGAVPVFDDYAHNPEKIVAAIRALQERYERVCIIFQPHGYGPLRFHLDGFAQAFDEVLRPDDRLFLLPVYDAGGSADRSITTKQLTEKIMHLQTIYVQTRRAILEILQTACQPSDAILITGARDDTLAAFAEETANMVDKLV